MADFVQQSIEEMLPELEQMRRVGLFTEQETKTILKKRRALEYKMRKTVKEKKDYLKYIAYEMRVLALVRKRRRSLNITLMRKEIDISIVQRIHKLYKLACVRFADDDSIWLNHIAFAKSKKEMSTVSHLFTSVLKVHPHKSGLWIMAAQFEMEDRSSMDNARHILQRAIRFNPDDRQLWIEYFRMELLNAEKLQKRDEVLGLASESEEAPRSAIHSGEVAKIVYRNAVEKIPDVEFSLSFLTVSLEFSFTDSLVDSIFNDLQSRYPEHEMAIAVVAKRPLLELDRLERLKEGGANDADSEVLSTEKTRQMVMESFRLFDECVRHISTESMWDMYLETCVQIAQRTIDSQLQFELLDRLHRTFHRAADVKRLSETMAVEWVRMLREAGRLDEALEASSVILSLHKRSSAVWLSRQSLLSLLYSQTSSASLLIDCFHQSIAALSKDDAAVSVWRFICEWCVANEEDKQLSELFEKGLESKSKVVCLYVKRAYLDWLALSGEIKAVRKLYKRVIALPPVSVDLFNIYLRAELAQEKPKMKKIRKVYDTVLQQYGADSVELWLQYLQLEMMPGGKPENIGSIHWRATHSLVPHLRDQFTSSYTILLNKHDPSRIDMIAEPSEM